MHSWLPVSGLQVELTVRGHIEPKKIIGIQSRHSIQLFSIVINALVTGEMMAQWNPLRPLMGVGRNFSNVIRNFFTPLAFM
jgi:hypothetical protein